MRVLLGSGGFRTPERIDLFTRQVRAFFGPVRRVLFVPSTAVGSLSRKRRQHRTEERP